VGPHKANQDLYDACSEGDLVKVKAALKRGAKIDIFDLSIVK
jgi:hypothetical protein